ncbi:hypothetical protein ACK3TF_005082 [Chlorella vulgaris]
MHTRWCGMLCAFRNVHTHDGPVKAVHCASTPVSPVLQAREQAALKQVSPPPQAAQHQGPRGAQQAHRGTHQHPQSSSDAMVHSMCTTRVPSVAAPTASHTKGLSQVGPPVHCVPALPSDKRHLSSVRDSDAKKLRLGSPGDEDDGGLLQYRGVRFQGDNWQARTKRLGKELSLGLYNTAEEAGMAYDLDRLQQQGGKAQRLNFPLLRQHYKQILSDLTDLHTPDGLLDFLAVAVQAAVKIARSVPGATAPENTGPAAASMLNPRRGIAPAERFSQSWQLAAAALPFGAPAEEDMAVDLESDMDELLSRLDPAHVRPATVQQVPVRHQAKQLADERSLAVGLAGGVAHVRLESGSGLAWQMTYLACPAVATVSEVSQAMALGVSQQYSLPPELLHAALAVANELDASADFNALCYEDASSGNLLLRGHVTIR